MLPPSPQSTISLLPQRIECHILYSIATDCILPFRNVTLKKKVVQIAFYFKGATHIELA